MCYNEEALYTNIVLANFPRQKFSLRIVKRCSIRININ